LVKATLALHTAAMPRRLRVLDPTIEGGQLLLGVLTEYLEVRGSVAGLELVGMDKNPNAILATRTALRLLERRVGVSLRRVVQLRCADSLSWLMRTRQRFDVVLNNPPWGESVTAPAEPRFSRSHSRRWKRESALAFVHGALHRLEPGGRYGFTLPAHLCAGLGGRDLRMTLAWKTSVTRIEWLSPAAFQPATVGAVSVSGQMGIANETRQPAVAVLKPGRPAAHVALRLLREQANGGWVTVGDRLDRLIDDAVRLDQVAATYPGVELYGLGKGRPPQSARARAMRRFDSDSPAPGLVPVLRARDLRTFTPCAPSLFIRWGPWLARQGKLAPTQEPRVHVRELCRRDGLLTVSVGPTGVLALHGVHTIVCHAIDPYVLATWLTNPVVASWIRARSAAFLKKDFQRITLAEIRAIPIPSALLKRDGRGIRGKLQELAARCARNPTDATLRRLQSIVASFAPGSVA
jgi:hypothetical protein